MNARQNDESNEKAEATYQYVEEVHGNGMFFFTMKYHGYLCPKCFWHNKSVTLYLRGTPDGIRVFETEYVVKAESEG